MDCRSGNTLANDQIRQRQGASNQKHWARRLQKCARSWANRCLREEVRYVSLRFRTTPSLEALQAYSLGYQAKDRDDFAAAVPFSNGPSSLDPNFAMAYAALGVCYSTWGKPRSRREHSQGLRAAERVSEREKSYIDSHYTLALPETWRKHGGRYEVSAQTYPREIRPHIN